MAQKFGVKLKKINRYHYRGQLYEKGKEYAVIRTLRDHLVGSGYFLDCLIEAPPEPQPVAAAAGAGDAPIATADMNPGHDPEKPSAPPVDGDKGKGAKLKLREPSADAVQVG
jgi:hypothetical protein